MEFNGNTSVKDLMDALAHEDISEETDELTHWGIKGMRWGVRRYQNKDGSLTPAGEKRLKKERAALKKEEQILKNRKAVKAKFDRLAAKRKSLEDQKNELDDDKKSKKGDPEGSKPTKKSVKDMSDDELLSGIRRAQLEQQYSALTTPSETAAKDNSFVKDFWNKAAVPAIQEAGKGLIKDSLTKLGKKYLGLETENTEDYVQKLGKEVKKMTLEKQYKKLKEEIEAEKAKSKETSEKSSSKTDDGDSNTSESSTKNTKEKVYEGTVEGVGSSSKSTKGGGYRGQKWTRESNVVDAEWYEVVDNNSTSAGRSYVSGYLNNKTSTLALPAPGLPSARDDD